MGLVLATVCAVIWAYGGVHCLQVGKLSEGLVSILMSGGAAWYVVIHLQAAQKGAVQALEECQLKAAEHQKLFPLLCDLGDRSNRQAVAGNWDAAEKGYLQIYMYLVSKGLVDQFLLGKAYLGLLMCQKHSGKGPSQDKHVTALTGAAEHVFKEKMLSARDNQVYKVLCEKKTGSATDLSKWDLSQATAPQFPVLHLALRQVVCVLDPKDPPKRSAGDEGLELDIVSLN